MVKKWLCAILTLAMLISLCPSTLAEENVDPYGAVSDAATEISVGREETPNVTYDEGEDSYNNYVVKYLESQLNVKYNYAFSVDTSSYSTKVNLAIASGDMPDVMSVSYMQLVQLVEAGAIEDLTDAFHTYCSPKLRKCFDSTNGITESLTTFDGKLMAIGDIQPGMDSVPVLWIRGDWLKECGLDMPTTWDEVVNVAKAFLDKNPGGKVDTGFAVASDFCRPDGGNYNLDALLHYFGSYPEQWILNDDGTAVYGSVTPETKEALGAIADLVKEGVINASMAVMDDEQCYELLANGECGMFFGAWWSGMWPVVNILGGMDDSASFVPVLAPLNAKDNKMDVCGMSPTSKYVVVKKGCSDEVKEAVIKTLNYQYDLDQAQAEGVRPNGMDSNFSWHYFPINILLCDYDAKEKQIADVMKVIAGEMKYDDLSGDGKTWYNGYTTVLDKGFRTAYETNLATANAWGWATGALCVESAGDTVNMFPAATYADTDSMERLWTSMKTLEEEYFLKVITGEETLDKWDEFVNEWDNLGGTIVTAEVNDYLANK